SMDQKHPNTLYVTMWQAYRIPWHLESGGPGSAIYKTTDGGAHWAKISSNPGFAGGILGKMGVDVSVNNPNVVYAMVQAREGGVFRSDNAGTTWTRVNSDWKLRQRAFYYMAVYIDPTNWKVAYAPQVDSVFKTSDGGKTWHAMTPPGDHHIVWINPRDPKILLAGDDGGATISVDGGKTWSTELNQPTGQFYHVVLDYQFPYHVYGAQQDEGAFEGPSASNEGLGVGMWHNVALGESTYIAVDPKNPKVTYGSGYYSAFVQLDTSTGEEKNISPWPKYMTGSSSAQTKYRFGWTHPVFYSGLNGGMLFEASQVIFKSLDFGRTWSVISPDLTRNDPSTEGPSGGPVDLDQTGAETFPDVASFAVSPLQANVMWAGSADGLVHVTTDGGTQWKLVTPPQLPQWTQISSIEPSSTSPGTAWLSANRYMWDDFHPYIYKTTDYGAHWTTLTNGLPNDQFVFVVRHDPREQSVLFAGTRSTVYVSLNGGANWQPATLNLPHVQVRDLQIDTRQDQLVAATHGRAFWILDNLAMIEQLARQSGSTTSTAQLFAPEAAWLTRAYGGGGGGGASSGQNPAYGATVYFNIPKDYNGSTPVTLSFIDSAGRTVRTFTLHRKTPSETTKPRTMPASTSSRATGKTVRQLRYQLRQKKEDKLTPEQVAELDQLGQRNYNLRELTAIEPGMNAFQWDMRYPGATEIPGLRLESTDDFSEVMNGPTILPGNYSVVLSYGGKRMQQPFTVTVDPRLHPTAADLEARLALATNVSNELDTLNKTVIAARAAEAHMNAAKRAQVEAAIANMVQFKVASSEGDLLHPLAVRHYLAFLMNSLDLAYQAPTKAEYDTYNELKAEADAKIATLNSLIR
ncbi:MAG: hypothetical protein JO165_02770, partial [Candidatus Eremiobacteraeota bacterium]|nr:hypothetical protein [Candidatus Eremiobacteraeota bacterium]